MERRLLDTEEAALLLHITPNTLRGWLADNRYGIRNVARKVGGKWLFFEDELLAWIDQKREDDEQPSE